MTKQLSDAELAELVAVCVEAGADLQHLVTEARRWKAIAGRLGLSLDILLDTLSRLEEVPRDPTSADWRDVEKVAAEESLSELWYAQRKSPGEAAVIPGEASPTRPRGSSDGD